MAQCGRSVGASNRPCPKIPVSRTRAPTQRRHRPRAATCGRGPGTCKHQFRLERGAKPRRRTPARCRGRVPFRGPSRNRSRARVSHRRPLDNAVRSGWYRGPRVAQVTSLSPPVLGSVSFATMSRSKEQRDHATTSAVRCPPARSVRRPTVARAAVRLEGKRKEIPSLISGGSTTSSTACCRRSAAHADAVTDCNPKRSISSRSRTPPPFAHAGSVGGDTGFTSRSRRHPPRERANASRAPASPATTTCGSSRSGTS